jgi:hypothetical protein
MRPNSDARAVTTVPAATSRRARGAVGFPRIPRLAGSARLTPLAAALRAAPSACRQEEQSEEGCGERRCPHLAPPTGVRGQRVTPPGHLPASVRCRSAGGLVATARVTLLEVLIDVPPGSLLALLRARLRWHCFAPALLLGGCDEDLHDAAKRRTGDGDKTAENADGLDPTESRMAAASSARHSALASRTGGSADSCPPTNRTLDGPAGRHGTTMATVTRRSLGSGRAVGANGLPGCRGSQPGGRGQQRDAGGQSRCSARVLSTPAKLARALDGPEGHGSRQDASRVEKPSGVV